MAKLRIFATDICEPGPHCSKERGEITDLYWFEEEGVHTMDERYGQNHVYDFEIEIDGQVVWKSDNKSG